MPSSVWWRNNSTSRNSREVEKIRDAPCGASLCAGRDEATRTPDPYVPNVVRYQLRYIPMSILGGRLGGSAFKRRYKGNSFFRNIV